MDFNNRMTEDEALEQAYDIFLEQAVENLDPADSLLFSLQFEERGGAELSEPSNVWLNHVDFVLDPDFFSEVIIGLAESDEAEIDDIFARILICREKAHPIYRILWKE
ncbi:HI1450 family dsDNA-mimic protein [Xenorhabdus innexi]|nr:HI1450 family dsDNA-mimic protein [Xenorhabdus innexi]